MFTHKVSTQGQFLTRELPYFLSKLEFKYSTNAPVSDDYDVVLSFITEFLKAGTVVWKLKLLFAQHNEHRVVFDKIIFLAQYYIFGKTNFKHIIIFGNLGWALTVLCLVFVFRKEHNLPFAYLLPIPYILLSFVHVENMFFPMASIQNYWLILFSILFLFSLRFDRLYYAVLLFPLALFTSGGGAILYPLGNLFFFMKRKWKELSIFFYNFDNSHIGVLLPLSWESSSSPCLRLVCKH